MSESPSKKITKLELVTLSVIIAIGFVVRLYKINNPVADWHSWRQVDTASVTRIFQENGINMMYPKYHDVSLAQTGHENPEGYRFVEFPIYNAFTSILYSLSGHSSLEVWGRIVSIVSALVSTVTLFMLGKRFVGSIGGLSTAFFYAMLPFNIYFTRIILPDPLAVSLGLAALYLFVRFSDADNTKYIVASGFLFALSILVKPFTIFYGIPMIYLAVAKNGFKKSIQDKRLWLFAAISLLPFIAWRFWISQFPEGIPHTKWAFNGDGIRFRPAFWRWIFGDRIGSLILGIWGLIIAAFGFVSINKKNAFVLWFLIGSFVFLSVFATANVRHDYYQTMIVPSICLLLGLGTSVMWKGEGFNKWLSRILLLFCVFMALGLSTYRVKEFYKVNHPEIIAAGKAVNEVTTKDDLVIAPYNKDTAFLYQTGRSGWPYVLTTVEDLVEKGATYYVSVNYDEVTREVMDKFNVVEENSSYVIVKLTPKPI